MGISKVIINYYLEVRMSISGMMAILILEVINCVVFEFILVLFKQVGW
jgi:hypothetical protein